MIILAALFLFGVLVMKSNHCNKCTNAWAKHFVSFLMVVCFATIGYALFYGFTPIIEILGSLIFVFVAAEALPKGKAQ